MSPSSPGREPASDDELWLLCQEGDRRAFEELVRRFGPPLLGHLRRLGASSDEASDLVQETFLRAYRFRHRFTGGSLRAWLKTLARNLFQDWQRQGSRRELPAASLPERPSDEGHVLDQLERREQLRWVEAQARVLLTPSQTEVVRRRLHGQSHHEIAAETGISANAVRVHLSNALRRLRQAAPPVERRARARGAAAS